LPWCSLNCGLQNLIYILLILMLVRCCAFDLRISLNSKVIRIPKDCATEYCDGYKIYMCVCVRVCVCVCVREREREVFSNS
jgi:hypothetical protein